MLGVKVRQVRNMQDAVLEAGFVKNHAAKYRKTDFELLRIDEAVAAVEVLDAALNGGGKRLPPEGDDQAAMNGDSGGNKQSVRRQRFAEFIGEGRKVDFIPQGI